MKFTLSIDLGNDAMQTGADVLKALRESLKGEERLLLDAGTAGRLWDENGNTVGKWNVTEDAPELPTPAVVPTCPKCGSHSVLIRADAYANYPLRGWDAEGEIVAEFEEPVSVTTFDDRIYMCKECGYENNLNDGYEFRPAGPAATGK
jgi:DNA-directed RNA polymerase subunit M/transcription elongation factor TFIIS